MTGATISADAAVRQEADWLIVGGGTAGAVLAARLTEDPDTTVLLLEAGADVRPTDAPAEMRASSPWLILDPLRFASYQWPASLTAKRTSAQSARPIIRGRGLGGTSLIYGMIAMRPSRADMDDWLAEGCAGWSYDDVLPYLRRLERDEAYGHLSYHGDSGPNVIVRRDEYAWGPVDLALRDAALRAGHEWCPDHNAPEGAGVSPAAALQLGGMRLSASHAYLERARTRPNLRILTGVTADSLLLSGTTVTGVSAVVRGEQEVFRSQRVILSAGAVMSPHLLLRSGIGPGLAAADLPVGLGVQDHAAVIVWTALKPHLIPDATARMTNCVVRFGSDGPGGSASDLLITASNWSAASAEGMFDGNHGGRTWGMTGGAQQVGSGFIAVNVARCQSRGKISPAGRNSDFPTIEENLLSDSSDITRLEYGFRHLCDLLKTPPFRAISHRIYIDPDGREPNELVTAGGIRRWLLANVIDMGHISSSCRMGAAGASDAVVDTECQVQGIDGLWVIDASVFPRVPRSNPYITVLMLAERMADILRGKAPGPARATAAGGPTVSAD